MDAEQAYLFALQAEKQQHAVLSEAAKARQQARPHSKALRLGQGSVALYDSTFSRTVWRLYNGAKGLVMWY
jgi:hypothetical protein